MSEERVRNHPVALLLIVLLASYALLFVLSVWTDVFSADLFAKISVTYAVVIGLSVIIYLIRREFYDDKKLKDEKYMD